VKAALELLLGAGGALVPDSGGARLCLEAVESGDLFGLSEAEDLITKATIGFGLAVLFMDELAEEVDY
jgi:hypothetical protein